MELLILTPESSSLSEPLRTFIKHQQSPAHSSSLCDAAAMALLIPLTPSPASRISTLPFPFPPPPKPRPLALPPPPPQRARSLLVCNAGFDNMLLSTTATVASKAKVSPFLSTLAGNPTFVSGAVAWAVAQAMKFFLNFFVERRWDFGMLVGSGGMPSSHSALCTALTTSVAICHGAGDALFPVCLGFSLIVMYDATGVRRHAGLQAAVLNMIIQDLFQGHPISQRKLKEFLGHTPSQVIAGALLGMLVACFCCHGYIIAI